MCHTNQHLLTIRAQTLFNHITLLNPVGFFGKTTARHAAEAIYDETILGPKRAFNLHFAITVLEALRNSPKRAAIVLV